MRGDYAWLGFNDVTFVSWRGMRLLSKSTVTRFPVLPILVFGLVSWVGMSPAPVEGREIKIRAVTSRLSPDAQPRVAVRIEPAERLSGAESSSRVIEVEVVAGEEHSVDLRGSSYWTIQAEAEGYWHQEVFLDLDDRRDLVLLNLVPTGEVRFEVRPGRFGEMAENVQVAFAPPSVGDESAGQLKGVVDCSLDENLVRCEVPEGRFDLRISPLPWAPSYRLGFEIEAGEISKLDPLELIRGSSISGLVVMPAGERAPKNTVVRIEPSVLGPEAADPRLRVVGRETEVGNRGFFQFVGLSPGSYSLIAEAPGYASSRIGPIEVRADLESALVEPLVLRRPASLTLELEPATDPWGEPWEVRLDQLSEQEDRTLSSVSGSATIDGVFHQSGLSPGWFGVTVLGSNDTRWYADRLEVGPGETFYYETLPLVRVEGALAWGDELVSGTLWFGTRDGARRVSFDVVDGEFDGLLPSPGTWPVEWIPSDGEGRANELRPVEVPEKRHVELNLEIPATEILGEVIDSGGNPMSQAKVEATGARTEDGKAVTGTATTDERGRFRILGLEPGAYGIQASLGRKESQVVSLSVSEDLGGGEVRLVLQEELHLFGRVTSGGREVAGARVVAWPTLGDAVGASIARTVTGPRGEFEITTSGSPGPWNLLVSVPDLAIHWGLTQVSGQDPVEITLDQHSGTLVVESGEVTLDSVVLMHGGSFLPVQGFMLMAFHQRQPQATEGALVIQGVEPGEYALCDTRAMLAAGGATEESCMSGVLAPYGELRLSPPPAGDPPAR